MNILPPDKAPAGTPVSGAKKAWKPAEKKDRGSIQAPNGTVHTTAAKPTTEADKKITPQASQSEQTQPRTRKSRVSIGSSEEKLKRLSENTLQVGNGEKEKLVIGKRLPPDTVHKQKMEAAVQIMDQIKAEDLIEGEHHAWVFIESGSHRDVRNIENEIVNGNFNDSKTNKLTMPTKLQLLLRLVSSADFFKDEQTKKLFNESEKLSLAGRKEDSKEKFEEAMGTIKIAERETFNKFCNLLAKIEENRNTEDLKKITDDLRARLGPPVGTLPIHFILDFSRNNRQETI